MPSEPTHRHGPSVVYFNASGSLRGPHFHFINHFPLSLFLRARDAGQVIEIEIQNETHQSHERIKMAVMPRIGEGLRLREPNGFWASYDILDLWYQKADYGDIWVPYLHVRKTPAELDAEPEQQFMPDDGRVLPFTT